MGTREGQPGGGGAGRVSVADLRRAYGRGGLDERDLAPSPMAQFAAWFAEAVAAELTEPNALVLGTVGADGQPNARAVLLKGHDERGFVVYTNYGSRKGREIAANPRVSMVFPWFDLERQVIVLGRAERVDRAETEAYFRSRPHGSQLGAWASPQSSVITSRAVLEERLAALARDHPPGSEVPVPPHWGGLRVVPASVEFWQGRPNRLHDRLRYRRAPDVSPGDWTVERLAP